MLCFLKATAGLERLATSRCHEGPGERGGRVAGPWASGPRWNVVGIVASELARGPLAQLASRGEWWWERWGGRFSLGLKSPECVCVCVY